MDQLTSGDPQRIGGYHLLARLGAGGMGQVYLARSDRGRTVAVKLIRRELAGQEEFRERFRREVRAARRVGGRWTAPVLDADTEAPVPWVATGYVAGPALNTVVARGPLPEHSVRVLGSGLAHALGEIHAAGLVHRDLKPSNVLITIDGPRVIDFGIARALDTDTTGGPTRAGSVIGSPGFMAPEQVLGDPVTAACDIFCLGAVLVYAATGRHPFGPGDSGRHAVMYRIVEREPDLSGVPEGLTALVRECLRKDPGRRPAPAEVLERTGAGAAASGRFDEPWLPGPLLAQLGRHAVRLLDTEQPPPEGRDARTGPPEGRNADTAPPEGWYALPAEPPDPAPTRPYAPGPPMPPPPVPAGEPGFWENGPGYGGTPPFPGSVPAAPRPTRRRAAVLGASALLTALAVSAAVWYTAPGDPPPASPGPDPTASASSAPPRESPKPPSAVPEAYLGTWRATFDNAEGTHTRTMTLVQGARGSRVMTLTGTGPSYECGWTATLRAPGPPLELGPTRVTSGDAATCSPGQWSRLTMPDDSTVVRELVGSAGDPLTYTRTDY
ncbi:protein kinase [Streptomyces sp. NPDC001985]|uniref:serine/threonine protein kinase n=1 Tax=Streptomyces sp. NPDC001985 TaxID=3154406 RepID=UPI003331E001